MIKVFLLCSGLGRVNRGYESFTQECFDALSDAPELDITLFKGGGPSALKQRVLWNLRRGGLVGHWLGRMTRKGSYWLEQVTFTLSLLPYITRQKPDVIYFSDCNIGNLLWHWRRLTKQNYKLLLSNGGPLSPPFPRWDFVQQVAPPHMELALAAGQDPAKQRLLPYGIRMEPELLALSPLERATLRRSLSLPEDRGVVLSVGLVNQSHKRMDYVVSEVAAMPEPRPYLVLLGQQDAETPDVRALAEKLLGPKGYQIRTVPYAEVPKYYQAADVFVLASRHEGFGRVYLEAMSWGLPCLAHGSALTRYVLGNIGVLGDFEQSGSLANGLCEVLQKGYDLPARLQRHHAAFERFSWERIRSEYVALIKHCAALSPQLMVSRQSLFSRIAANIDRLQSRLRVEWCRLRYPRTLLGRHLGIRGKLLITGPGKVLVGEHCYFDNATGHPNKLQTFDAAATVTIGNSCYLNGIEIAAQTSVTIGNRCIIADCLIMDTDFHSTKINRHDTDVPVHARPVVIGENVWIGNRTIILQGVQVGENSVVGAGTVLRQSVPANAVVIGNPQQIVKMLKPVEAEDASRPQTGL